MYDFCMDMFERYPGFFTFFAVLAIVGILAILYVIALFFYLCISRKMSKCKTKEEQVDVDQRQDEEIKRLSNETKKALELQQELEYIRDKINLPKDE